MYLEHLLTDEQKAIRNMIGNFVEKEIMPIRREMEEDYSLVEGVLQKLLELGIGRAGDPDENDGHNQNATTTETIMVEELAKGDAGVSLCVGGVTGGLVKAAERAGNKAVAERFGPAFRGTKVSYACLSMTDSASGADTENPLLQGRGISTRAHLDADLDHVYLDLYRLCFR